MKLTMVPTALKKKCVEDASKENLLDLIRHRLTLSALDGLGLDYVISYSHSKLHSNSKADILNE